MTDSQERSTQTHVLIALGLVVASAVFGAIIGFVLSALTGVEEVMILEIPFPISPLNGALYGGITVGTFIVTLYFVVIVITYFEDTTVEE